MSNAMIDILRTIGTPALAQQADTYAQSIELEDAFVEVISSEVISRVSNKLRLQRCRLNDPSAFALIDNAHALRAESISLNKWAKWRKPGQDPIVAFRVIETKIINLIAKHLNLTPGQITVRVEVDSADDISRLKFRIGR